MHEFRNQGLRNVTDEEIENEMNEWHQEIKGDENTGSLTSWNYWFSPEQKDVFRKGAKWMRKQLTGK